MRSPSPVKHEEGSAVQGTREAERLCRAVARYVESQGGKVLVAGGIQIQQWPGQGRFNFIIGVKCTGQLPAFAAKPSGRRCRDSEIAPNTRVPVPRKTARKLKPESEG
jgi:hypothetical protein